MNARAIVAVLVGGTLLAGIAPAWLLVRASARQPELGVRSTFIEAHTGSIIAERAPGQGFRCTSDGLARIEVRVLATEPRSRALPFELVLRRDAPDGPEVRRATFDPDRDKLEGSWIAFGFEPIEDSSGRDFFFEVRPSDGAERHYCGLRVRWRGQVDEKRAWGEATAYRGSVDARFQSSMPDLSAVAVAFERIEPDAHLVLEVFEGDRTTAARRVELEPGPLRRGWVFFPFEPIAASYAAHHRLSLKLDGRAAVRTIDGELVFQSYHGRHQPQPALLGMTTGGELHTDRDLFFRVYADGSAAATWRRLRERAGVRPLLAAGLWIAVVALALGLALSARDTSQVG